MTAKPKTKAGKRRAQHQLEQLPIKADDILDAKVLKLRTEDKLDASPTFRTDADGGSTGVMRLDASASAYGAPGNWRSNR